MKKLVFIILSIQILSSGQFLNEVMKIRNLVDHYQDHRRSCSNMTIAVFIQLHYFDPIHKDADPKNHAALPLHHSCCFVNFVFHTPGEAPAIGVISPDSGKPSHTENQVHIHSINPASVFQPPRTA